MPHHPGASSALLFISKDFLEVFLVPLRQSLPRCSEYLPFNPLALRSPNHVIFFLLCSGGSNFSFSPSKKKKFLHILNPMYLLINVKFRFPADSEMRPPKLAESHLRLCFQQPRRWLNFTFRSLNHKNNFFSKYRIALLCQICFFSYSTHSPYLQRF